jgi:hypothetical protein
MKNILELIFLKNSEISPRKKKKKKLDLLDPMIIKNHLQLKSVQSRHFELVCSLTSLLSFPLDRVT